MTRGLVPFNNGVGRLFDDLFNDPWFNGEDVVRTSLKPAIDILDEDNQITVRAEIPGVDKKDLSIEVKGNLLTISGEKKYKKEKANHVECSYGKFQRVVRLPATVDTEKAEASYSDGVLNITMTKTSDSSVKRIPLKD